MDQRIYKYQLETEGITELKLPEDFSALSVMMHEGDLHLWCVVDLDVKEVIANFSVIRTGKPNGRFGLFLGTVDFKGTVLHVFQAHVNNNSR